MPDLDSAPPQQLSPHLTWAEFTATQHREFLEQQEHPPAEIIANALRFAAEVFEPARQVLGVPIRLNSGYRCPALNAAIGGSPTSAHKNGLAADCCPLGLDLVAAYRRLAESKVPFDQLIFEFGRWIHLGAARPGRMARRETLMIFTAGNYEPFNPNDPRLA